MKIIRYGDTLNVSELDQLATPNAHRFRSAVTAALAPQVRHLEIDLSNTELVDCGGLGALLSLRDSLRKRHADATVSLFNPAAPVQRLLEITRTDRLFTSSTATAGLSAKLGEAIADRRSPVATISARVGTYVDLGELEEDREAA